jgi:predicted nucleic acid-binding protein
VCWSPIPGGLLRALAAGADGGPAWPDYQAAIASARVVIVPALVLAEVDYSLRKERKAMRKLVAEIFDPKTTYELEPVAPMDVVRALQIDARFPALELGLVDGLVAAVAERRRVHHRDFSTLRIGPRWNRSLQLVP